VNPKTSFSVILNLFQNPKTIMVRIEMLKSIQHDRNQARVFGFTSCRIDKSDIFDIINMRNK